MASSSLAVLRRPWRSAVHVLDVVEAPAPLEADHVDDVVRASSEVSRSFDLVARGEVEEHRDDDERDHGVQRLDGHVVPGLRRNLDLGAAAPVEDDAPQDQAPDQHARGERGRPGALPEGEDPRCLFRDRAWACRGGGSPCMCNRWRSPGPGPQPAPAAASAASGAATSGRSRWDSRSAFPRVSPARSGCGRLAGRSPPWRGQGFGCLCGPNPTGRYLGSRGEGAQRAAAAPRRGGMRRASAGGSAPMLTGAVRRLRCA